MRNLLDDPAVDQVLLDDPFEHGRIASPYHAPSG